VESGKPSLNLGLIVPHSLFREKQYRYSLGLLRGEVE
jgi:hypothetical protein